MKDKMAKNRRIGEEAGSKIRREGERERRLECGQ